MNFDGIVVGDKVRAFTGTSGFVVGISPWRDGSDAFVVSQNETFSIYSPCSLFLLERNDITRARASRLRAQFVKEFPSFVSSLR